ncbi:cache domain-containing protein [Pseudomonas sp. LB3P14]
MVLVARALLVLLTLLPGLDAIAQTKVDTTYEQEARDAKALLQKAVSYYQAHGDEAFAAFSRQGEFINGQLYVYVVDTNGVMLASGGPSVLLVGQNMSDVLTGELKEAFDQAVTKPEGTVHDGEYRWSNWQDAGKVERKHAYFQRVGNRVLAVGYYLPRSNPQQAKQLLDQASEAIRQDPDSSLQAINGMDKRFYQDDLYVFVVDLKSRKFIAHGYNRRLVGTDFQSLKSPDGTPIGQRMLDSIKTKDQGELQYLWRNPVTTRNEHKHAYLRKVGDYMVAVGYYSR